MKKSMYDRIEKKLNFIHKHALIGSEITVRVRGSSVSFSKEEFRLLRWMWPHYKKDYSIKDDLVEICAVCFRETKYLYNGRCLTCRGGKEARDPIDSFDPIDPKIRNNVEQAFKEEEFSYERR